MGFLGTPFGYIMRLLYNIVNNYGVTIIIFTVLLRFILFPLAVKQQKNLGKSSLFTERQREIQKKYGKDKEKYQQELMKAQQEEGFNPAGGCLPAVIQMIVLFGLIEVIYRPLKYFIQAPNDAITAATKLFTGRVNIAQLGIISDIQNGSTAYKDVFSSEVLTKIKEFKLSLFGLDMGIVPKDILSFKTLFSDLASVTGIIALLIPILSGVFSFLSVYASNKQQEKSGTMPQQGAGSMKIMMYFMPLISVIFAFQFPLAIGIYWIVSSALAFVQTIVINKLYPIDKMREQAIKEREENKKSGKKSRYQMLLEAQQQAQGNTSSDDKSENVKKPKDVENLSDSEILALARKRMAEKYGDE